MEYDELTIQKLKGEICPYCLQPPKLIDSAEVYGQSFGMMWRCDPCDAHVGCHKNSKRHAPLGRLADKHLRRAKRNAHAHFDPLWRKAVNRGRSKKEARKAAYQWVSKELGIPFEYCHIGMFDCGQCLELIKLCLPYLM